MTIRAHFAAHAEATHHPHALELRDAEPPSYGPVHIGRSSLPIYSAKLRHIGRQGLSVLKRIAWLDLHEWSVGVFAAATVVKLRGELVIAKVESGDFPKRVAMAVRRLRAQCHVDLEDELRLIEIGALHLHAVWLHHHESQGTDVFLPLLPNSLHLIPGRRYATDVVDRRLASAARRARAL